MEQHEDPGVPFDEVLQFLDGGQERRHFVLYSIEEVSNPVVQHFLIGGEPFTYAKRSGLAVGAHDDFV